MKKFIVSILCFLGGILWGHAEGISFFKGTFEEAVHKAVQERKMIFMDVYTPWCGPCLNMEEHIFSLYQVGEFYNSHFINIKVDWESQEGKKLAQRFHVASYPAFLFIEPEDGTVIHEHGGYQNAEVFLRLGEAALNSELCSSGLLAAYESGNRTKKLLLNYAGYKAERRDMPEALRLLHEAEKQYRLSIEDKEVADFFFEYFTVTEITHPFCRYFLNHRQQMYKLYGKEKVDRKLFDLYRFSHDKEEIEQLADFDGKKFLLSSIDFNRCMVQKKYKEADRIIQSMIENPDIDQEELYELLKFTARSVMKRGGDKEWKKQCLSYLQYVAYNQKNRQDSEAHFLYAAMLEQVIRENPELHSFFPESVVQGPKTGRNRYSLSSRTLAPKK